MGAFKVTQFHDLVMNKAGIAVGDDEMAFAFAHGQAGHQLRRPRACRIDAASGGNARAVGQRHAALRQQRLDRGARAKFGPVPARFVH